MRKRALILTTGAALFGALFAGFALNQKEESTVVHRHAEGLQEADQRQEFGIVRIEFADAGQSILVEIEGDLRLVKEMVTDIEFYIRNQKGEMELTGWDLFDDASGTLNIERAEIKTESGRIREIQKLKALPDFSLLKVKVSCGGTSKSKAFTNTDDPDI